eukprot:TRINITY_DN6586_c0_g1_i1.p2 TRINITY_DN6586_c0_g1~~TRINITY_DN6586_c0_g1_i1.p2  ORF type:complete len:149 (-),score=53.33 TRINITY_DN6586_c0_g1_i1:281-727(-)
MIRRPPRSTHCISSAASDVYKRQKEEQIFTDYEQIEQENLQKKIQLQQIELLQQKIKDKAANKIKNQQTIKAQNLEIEKPDNTLKDYQTNLTSFEVESNINFQAKPQKSTQSQKANNLIQPANERYNPSCWINLLQCLGFSSQKKQTK